MKVFVTESHKNKFSKLWNLQISEALRVQMSVLSSKKMHFPKLF